MRCNVKVGFIIIMMLEFTRHAGNTRLEPCMLVLFQRSVRVASASFSMTSLPSVQCVRLCACVYLGYSVCLHCACVCLVVYGVCMCISRVCMCMSRVQCVRSLCMCVSSVQCVLLCACVCLCACV